MKVSNALKNMNPDGNAKCAQIRNVAIIHQYQDDESPQHLWLDMPGFHNYDPKLKHIFTNRPVYLEDEQMEQFKDASRVFFVCARVNLAIDTENEVTIQYRGRFRVPANCDPRAIQYTYRHGYVHVWFLPMPIHHVSCPRVGDPDSVCACCERRHVSAIGMTYNNIEGVVKVCP